MNEITKIHLGRQAFTIAVDAHKELQEYLRAIKKHMGETDEAVEEVELRMAELLLERGIQGDKVVLLKDIEYLKEQLGEPGDFGDGESEEAADDSSVPKRLFRDTEHGMVAGVAAGIGKYFGIDPVWIRLAFAALVFAGGSGAFLYFVLWVIVPEAKTKSERLQMQGKSVTVETLKEVVERADVKGAAVRAQHTVEKVVHGVLKVVLGAVGLGLMLGGIAALLGLTAISTYWALNHDLVPGNIFPVGASEVLLICLALVALALVALFFIIAGLAMTKRKWPLQGWALGAIVAVFLASLAVGGALAADAAPKVRDRYEASRHTYTRTVSEFHKLNVLGTSESDVRYEESPNYAVIIKYWGDANFSKMVTDVKDQTLTVDSRTLAENMRCQKLCLFHSPIIEIVVQGPKLQEVTADMQGSQLSLPGLNNQTLTLRAISSSVLLDTIAADNIKAERAGDGVWLLTFTGAYTGSEYGGQQLSLFQDTASIVGKNIDLTFDGQCGGAAGSDTSSYIYLNTWFEKLTLNGQVIGTAKDLRALHDEPGASANKCLDMPRSSMDDNDAVDDVRAVHSYR